MKFDIYGRFQLEVLREGDAWIAYRTGVGTRLRDATLVIPEALSSEEIARYLDDLFHELCGPGQSIRLL
jgi:hypothetical protein